MSARYDTYSLKRLLTKMAGDFPGIREVYIFGSRRHRTMSIRSDVDLLIFAGPEVRPEDVRDFCVIECPFLDCFFVERGVATSCANGSKVRARSDRDLVYRLDALRLWSSSTGFTDADVDWDFHTVKGYEPVMTTMISAAPIPSKEPDPGAGSPPTVPAGGQSRWHDLPVSPLAIVIAAVLTAGAVTFGVIHEVQIVPLEREVSRLQVEQAPHSAQEASPSVSSSESASPTRKP